MKKINRIISTVVLVCFVFNTIAQDFAFAQPVSSKASQDNLAPGSLFSNLRGTQPKDMAIIQNLLEAQLPFLIDTNDPETLRAKIVKRKRDKDIILGLRGVQFFVHEMTTDGSRCSLMCRVSDGGLTSPRTYYAIFSLTNAKTLDLQVLTKLEYSRFKKRFVTFDEFAKAAPRRKALHPRSAGKIEEAASAPENKLLVGSRTDRVPKEQVLPPVVCYTGIERLVSVLVSADEPVKLEDLEERLTTLASTIKRPKLDAVGFSAADPGDKNLSELLWWPLEQFHGKLDGAIPHVMAYINEWNRGRSVSSYKLSVISYQSKEGSGNMLLIVPDYFGRVPAKLAVPPGELKAHAVVQVDQKPKIKPRSGQGRRDTAVGSLKSGGIPAKMCAEWIVDGEIARAARMVMDTYPEDVEGRKLYLVAVKEELIKLSPERGEELFEIFKSQVSPPKRDGRSKIQKTPLYQEHVALGAKMVNIDGRLMPLHYSTGVLKEGKAARRRAGIFDISHMGILEITGEDAAQFLQHATTNDINMLKNDGDTQYSLLAAEDGSIIDDIRVYRLGKDRYMLLVNASNTGKDQEHLAKLANGKKVAIRNLRDAGKDSKVAISLQGSFSERTLQPAADFTLSALRRGKSAAFDLIIGKERIPALVSRTGYTGDDSFEIFVHPDHVVRLWRRLLKIGKPMGVLPCGLGSRDSLRMETGHLYGNEWQEDMSPYEAGFDRAIKLDKGTFLGKADLAKEKEVSARQLVSIVMDGRGILRNGEDLFDENGTNRIGRIMSSARSPTLNNKVIALALVDKGHARPDIRVSVTMRGKTRKGSIVQSPVYMNNEDAPFHIVNTDADRKEMLKVIGATEEDLFRVVREDLYKSYLAAHDESAGEPPLSEAEFFRPELNDVPPPASEDEIAEYFTQLSQENWNLDDHPSYLGANYKIPAIVDRVAGNGGFKNPYTQYQAEISQGYLKALYLYQSLVCRLTGMGVANASLYDGATALAEAMLMAHRLSRKKRKKILVVNSLNPHHREVLDTYARAAGLDIETVKLDERTHGADLAEIQKSLAKDDVAAVIIQQPDLLGSLEEEAGEITDMAHKNGALCIVHVNGPHTLMSMKSPAGYGEAGADIVTAEGQPLGNPLYGGGPSLGILAIRNDDRGIYKKGLYIGNMPGRLVGRTVDSRGNEAFTLTRPGREQFLARENATSNICTSSALCALRATIYMLSLGEKGLKEAQDMSSRLSTMLKYLLEPIPGFKPLSAGAFGNIAFRTPIKVPVINEKLKEKGIIGGLDISEYAKEAGLGENAVLFSLTDTNSEAQVYDLIREILDIVNADPGVRQLVETRMNKWRDKQGEIMDSRFFIPDDMARQGTLGIPALSDEELYEIYWAWAEENFDMDKGGYFYPLGSCTMKYNPLINEFIAALAGFANVHPRQPVETMQGTLRFLYEFKARLCKILGMYDMTLQPAAGAHGEVTALMMFKKYFEDHGEEGRTIVITPDSSHGTNPASAAMAGMTVVKVATSDETGTVDIKDLKRVIEEINKEHGPGKIAAIMLTTPNTLGILESEMPEIAKIIHEAGGFVYMDGANMNALIGQVNLDKMGVDGVQLNGHKTLACPHGGGGPCSGPVAVVERLSPYLPTPTIEHDEESGLFYLDYNRPLSIGPVLANPGSFGVLLKAAAYLRALGDKGLLAVSTNAVINANYLFARVKKYCNVKHAPGLLRMHEFVVGIDKDIVEAGITTMDIAKMLIDEGFHPPTVYFPLIVPEAMMIEPTETASKKEMDRFADALIKIMKKAKMAAKKVKKLKEKIGLIEQRLKGEGRSAAEIADAVRPMQSAIEAIIQPFTGAPHTAPVGRVDVAAAGRHLDLSTPDIKGMLDAAKERIAENGDVSAPPILREAEAPPPAAQAPSENDDKITALVADARMVGADIPTEEGKRCRLLLMTEFFVNSGELVDYQSKYGDRIDLETLEVSGRKTVTTLSLEDIVMKISQEIIKSKSERERTVMQLPAGLPEKELKRLEDAHIRFIIADPAELLSVQYRYGDKETQKYREWFQKNTLAMMILVRHIKAEDIEKNTSSAIYRLLACYLELLVFTGEKVAVDDYIKAIATGDISILVKGCLSYRPTEPHDAAKDREKISHALIFA